MLYALPPTPLYTPLFGMIAGIIVSYLPYTIYTGLASLAVLIGGLTLSSPTFLRHQLLILSAFFITGIALTTYKLTPARIQPFYKNHYYTVLSIETAQNKDWPFKVRLQTIPKQWWQVPLTFMIYTHHNPRLVVGDRIKIPYLSIQKPKDKHFDLYLKKEGLDGTTFIFSLKSYTKETPRFSPLRFIHSIKQHCLTATKAVLSPPTYALFLSVFLGNKDAQKEQLEDLRPLFLLWGLSHQLARSGLHLLFLLPLLILILSFLPAPFWVKEFLIITLVGLYALLSWTSISFLRACCCFFILKLANIYNHFMPPLHILLLTALLVLFFNPLQLFFLDFQLSFFLSMALLWINHVHHARSMNDAKNLNNKK